MVILPWAMGLGDSGPTSIEGKGTHPKIENGFNVAVDFDCHFEFQGNTRATLFWAKTS